MQSLQPEAAPLGHHSPHTAQNVKRQQTLVHNLPYIRLNSWDFRSSELKLVCVSLCDGCVHVFVHHLEAEHKSFGREACGGPLRGTWQVVKRNVHENYIT